MAIWDPPAEIGLLLYPGAALATVHGMTDMFTVADKLAREHVGATAPALRVSHWLPNPSTDAVDCVFDTHPQLAHNRPVAVIVPGSWQGQPAADVTARLVKWLIAQHAAGTVVCSVCGGAFVLAETGLLAGRHATTHWTFFDSLSARFPDIHVDEQRIIIEDGNLITGGGVLAWADLGLKLVDRHLGPTVMLETARFMLVDPPGREQRYYSNFAPKLNHGDAAVLKLQHWFSREQRISQRFPRWPRSPVSKNEHFFGGSKKATGLKPTDYCQRLRVGKAREMLEFTSKTIDQISRTIGYEDPGSFRKVFQRVTGLSPTDYRRRFATT